VNELPIQNMDAMATSNLMSNDLSYQIIAVKFQILGNVPKFGGFCLHIKKKVKVT